MKKRGDYLDIRTWTCYLQKQHCEWSKVINQGSKKEALREKSNEFDFNITKREKGYSSKPLAKT